MSLVRSLSALALCLVAASATVACSVDTAREADKEDTTAEATDALARTKVVGSIQSGETKTASYTSTPRYRAFTFDAKSGETADAWVYSTRDALGWIVGPNGETIAHDDDADSTTSNAHMKAQIAKDGKYLIVFREYELRSAGFKVSLNLSRSFCEYDGIKYPNGSSFEIDCNTCSCVDGVARCTKMACPAQTCTYGGNTYAAGASFPSTDGCNTCSCSADGSVACTEKACAATCSANGQTYQVGDSFKIDCNTCTCLEGGVAACTKMACPDPIPTCTANGQTYNLGDTFKIDCNTCSCGLDGAIACTKMFCGATCDPAKEPDRKYIGSSPAQCQLIKYACPANTVGFANDCGCGCEQAAECPDFLNCMPGPGATPCSADVQTKCPYTEIAY